MNILLPWASISHYLFFSGYVQKVTGVPDDLNVGQVTWAPSHGLEERQFLVFVGWPSVSENFQTYRKLGIKYCFNRPCALYAIEVLQKEGYKPLLEFEILGLVCLLGMNLFVLKLDTGLPVPRVYRNSQFR